MKKVAVVLPVLNEVENITTLLQRLHQALIHYDTRIFIIDDGSTDGTLEKIQIAQQHNPQIALFNRKKTIPGCRRGEALVFGVGEVVKFGAVDFIVELDGDLSHSPEEIEQGILLIQNGADVALGSKYLLSSKIIGRSMVRNFISRANSMLFRVLLGFSISDYSNGFRIYNMRAAEILLKATIKYGSPIYLAEAITNWKLQKLHFAEFAITYNGREKGKSKVIVSDVVMGLIGAIHVSFCYWLKRATRS